jgi:hypothetical protein
MKHTLDFKISIARLTPKKKQTVYYMDQNQQTYWNKRTPTSEMKSDTIEPATRGEPQH